MSETGVSRLQQRWEWLEANRSQIATELNLLSTDMPRQDRILLRRLANWFSGSQGFESAIQRSDVLAMCVPLIQDNDGEKPSQSDVRHAVRVGVCTIGRTMFYRGGLLRLLLYPAVILAAMAVFAVFFSAWLSPQFELIFDEFGIPLPRLTLLVLELARLVRASWLILFAGLAALAVFVMLANNLTSGRRDAAESWLGLRLKSTRTAAAGWAWHLAMLLEAGVVPTTAVEIAGNAQKNSWLKRACKTWLRERSPSQLSNDTVMAGAFGSRYQLISSSLGVDNRAAQVDLFKEIATYYWACSHNISAWWIRWLNSILFWLFMLGILLAVFAIYSPIISIISALTGGF